MSDAGVMAGLTGALQRALGKRAVGTDKSRARATEDQTEQLGVWGCGIHSEPDEIAEWTDRLWHEQDDYLDWQEREWQQHLYYTAGEQLIAYFRQSRRWLPRKTLPWRIRSIYNVCQKAVTVRVSRLTENKPTVTVQAASTDRDDIEKAEYKETAFWSLWESRALHLKIVRARRWASKCASGFLLVGWDPSAGPRHPRTQKVPIEKTVTTPVMDPTTGQPALDPLTGQPQQQTVQVFDRLAEYYLSKSGQPIPDPKTGQPTETTCTEPDPDDPRQQITVSVEPPETTDFYHDGEVSVEVGNGFGIRWDRYVDDIPDSWYVQDAAIVPASKVYGMWPDKLDDLKEAAFATEEDRQIQWAGLANQPFTTQLGTGGASSEFRATKTKTPQHGRISEDYLVRRTWIYPKDEYVRRMWGSKGRLLVTVGGKLIHNSPLPVWALKRPNVIQFIDIPEEGNHYGKSFLRDVTPLQDDINRSRSQMAEKMAVRSRIIFTAVQNNQMNVKTLGGMPGVLLTHREGAKPETLNMSTGEDGSSDFYQSSLAAAADLGNMNEASSGKLPAAGLAAKAIYALQYADERSITEVSNLQDISLKRLAEAIDEVMRAEYKEERKVRLIGRDRAFMTERVLKPEDLATDVDYHFVPGSMLARQKEAIKNELFELLDKQLIEPWRVKKLLSTATPDAFRESYDVQEAHARRVLQRVLDGNSPTQIHPWEDPAIHAAVLEEFMLTSRWDTQGDDEKQVLTQLWQAYKTTGQPQPQPAAGAPPTPGAPAPPIGAPPTAGGAPPAQGATNLAQTATAAMEPPAAFGQPTAGA